MADTQLPKLLQGLQQGLDAKLGINRDVFGHAGTKGNASESDWIDLLTTYLPARYCVSKAFVIDSNNKCSEQIDVVIHDRQYSPFVFKHEDGKVVPAESVYGAFEVKQEMTKEYVEYASNKVASVRNLHRTSLPIPHAEGVAAAKNPPHILGGLLCLDSAWKPPFGEPCKEAALGVDTPARLDFICSARHGVAELVGNVGNPGLKIEENKAPLAYFLLRLIARLQDVATVPRLDVMAYAKWIDA